VSIVRKILGEGYRNERGSPILPIGQVNLTTGANALFGMLWNGWTEGEGTNILVQSADYPGQMQSGQMRVVHTSGGGEGYKVGDRIDFVHDQTRRPIGDGWTISGLFPHTKEGLAQLKSKSGKNSLSFATFK